MAWRLAMAVDGSVCRGLKRVRQCQWGTRGSNTTVYRAVCRVLWPWSPGWEDRWTLTRRERKKRYFCPSITSPLTPRFFGGARTARYKLRRSLLSDVGEVGTCQVMNVTCCREGPWWGNKDLYSVVYLIMYSGELGLAWPTILGRRPKERERPDWGHAKQEGT
ncbi:hypothetical protein VTK73DRAFT_4071 [Phialemonium thermophilum]|uniref:Uncharacterized protein n=1 Tax=Phialemonium thermophilum TaxID=223376 RepID=A0ABR3VBT4_9PEZI